MVVARARRAGGSAYPRVLSAPGLALLGAAAVAAAWTIARAQGMWTAGGSMGIGWAPFIAMWSVMMTAMMLPSLTPVASLYIRSLPKWRAFGGTGFVAGYIVIWAASGSAAYGLARVADAAIGSGGWTPRVLAAGVLATTALYYLTPIKYRMLGYCRSPLGLVIQYGGYRTPLRHVRAGMHHGLTCLGCCWSLMALMAVFGVMNVLAMAALAIVVGIEKLWARGIGFARVVGGVSAVLAVAVLFVPEIAVGLGGGMAS